MLIKYYRKNVYGHEYIYIQDKKLAKSISELLTKGKDQPRKTLLRSEMISLTKLGYTFEEIIAP